MKTWQKRALAAGALVLCSLAVWAAVDTAARRASVLSVFTQSTKLVIPDSTIGDEDRQTLAGMYGGISASTSCSVNDISPVPGTTVSMTCPAFAGTITHLTTPTGDIINAEAGASTTAADFIIPAALTGFVAGGALVNTEWSVIGDWVVDDNSETNLTVEMQIDPPQLAGPDYWFDTVTAPVAGDSVLPAAAAAGDEFYIARVSGTSVVVNTNGSTSAAGDYELNATLWDESLNGGLGAWSAVENTAFDATAPAFVSAAIDATGLVFTLVLDEAASQGAGWGSSNLTISASGGAATLTYSSGNGTDTHLFAISRTIESGETVTVSWAPAADGLEDAAGNDVASFSGESVTNNSGGDVTAPTVSTRAVPAAGTTITVGFDENVTRGGGYLDGSWTVTASGGAVTLTYASGDGTASHSYTTSRTIGSTETVTLDWATTANGLEDAAGNDLVAFTGQSVTNNSTQDLIPPTVSSAAIPAAGTTLVVTFDENTTQGAGYLDGDWTVSASGGAVTLTYASGDGTTAHTLTTSRTINAIETVTLDWAGTANGLEDGAGNDLASFSGQSVTNNSTADVVLPTFVNANISSAVLTVNYSETVTHGAGGNGGAALTCSGGAVTPTYASGAGSTQLSYSLSRSVDPGETCTLDYTQPGNGIEDSTGNDLATYSGQAVSLPSGANCPNVIPYPITQPVKTPLRLPICA